MGKYIVTGAAGFIASRVCEDLLNDGHSVIGIDNFDPVYDLRIKEWRLKNFSEHPNFNFYRESICDKEKLRTLFQKHQKIDGVINLAAKAGVRDSMVDPWSYYETNLTGTLNLLEMCRKNDVKKFILASTSSIYGENAPYPTPENADSSHPLQPYAASKKAAETLCHSYHFLYGIDVTVLRYFTVYGPAGRPSMSMYRFNKWISEGKTVHVFGDGTQTRGFTYLEDISCGTILALKPVGFEIVNLGGHESISINNLIKKFEAAIGKSAKIEFSPAHPADMSASWANVEKAKHLLGWSPKFTLDEGILQVVKWYQQEYEWASQVSIK